MDRGAGLAMDDQVVSAGPGEVLEIAFGLDDHQMHVDRLRRRLAHRLDDNRADRDVRYETPVHHIDMDPVSPRLVNCPDLVGEPAEIGGQDRRSDDYRASHWVERAADYAIERHLRP